MLDIFGTSGTFPASPGSFMKKTYNNMTINIIHILSNVVKNVVKNCSKYKK